jgi:Galactose oxidase, central domain
MSMLLLLLLLLLAVTGEERLVMFGGRRYEGMAYKYFNELWAYDAVANLWEQLVPLPSVQTHGSVSEVRAML